MDFTCRLPVLGVFLCFAFHAIFAKRVLLITVPLTSHVLQANSIAEALLDRGHEVAILWNVRGKPSESIMHPKVELIRFDTGNEPAFQGEEYERKVLSMELENADSFSVLEELIAEDMQDCKSVLGNKKLEAAVAGGKFDFMVVDGLFRCFVIIPERLEIPFAIFMAFLPMDTPHAALQSPFLVRTQLDDMFTEESSFYSKIIKVLVIALFTEPDIFGEYSNQTVPLISTKFDLWLYDVCRVLDTPVPVSPNVIHVGGLNTREPKPLQPGALKTFVESSSKGVILVSFGSYVKLIPERFISIMFEAFTDLDYDFVWKLSRDTITPRQIVPKNIMLLDWLPQNDLLGHPNVKLFFTHCGNNGQHEALFNRVPMLGFPLFGDQIFNAKRLVTLKMGNYIRASQLSKENLINMIRDITGNEIYKESITKASNTFKDQPMTPKATAAYWIDHVMTHGAGHLKSATNEMPWYQILMFDVLLVVVVVISFIAIMTFCICRCVYKRCCRYSQKMKTS